MEAGGEPSESEPTFTPPGSLQHPEDLPIEQSELRDLDFDILEQQQFGGQQLDNPARGSWADQQDQPEGLDPNVDLIDLGGDGAAFGAPAEDNPATSFTERALPASSRPNRRRLQVEFLALLRSNRFL